MSEIILTQVRSCQRTARNVMALARFLCYPSGDGLFARRLANGNCVRCDTFLDGALEQGLSFSLRDNHGRKR